MTPLFTAMLYSLIGGITIPIGGFLARVEHIHQRWLQREFRHFVLAFGAGALLAAVALVLVPEGISALTPTLATLAFGCGGLVFFAFRRWLSQHGGAGAMLVALVLDFVPEALAMGAMFTSHAATALLLAVMIALQNLPESFNAFREIRQGSGMDSTRILIFFALVSLLGPLSAWVGFTFLAANPALLGAIMLFAAGGILYLIFQDIAPKVPLENDWAPPLGVVLGFMLGLLGQMVI